MFVKKMRQLGMTAQFVAGGGVMDANFIKLAGPAAEGAKAWEYGRPLSEVPRGSNFAAQFRQAFGFDMLTYAPFAYDSTWVAIKAMQAANSVKPKDINAALKRTEYLGITGPIAFDKYGDLKNASSTLYEVKGGSWVTTPTKPGT
jgi:branched-chain amino acid transport system substrate-binding protein